MGPGHFFILTAGFNLAMADLRIVDLTHTFGQKTIHWPTLPDYNFTKVTSMKMGKGVVIEAYYFQTSEHSGTHMDSPSHFCPGKKQVHEVSMDDLSGPGVVLDFVDEANKNPDYEMSLQDLKAWETKNGQIPEEAIVLMKFGWNKYWPNYKEVFKTDDIKDTISYHWPGMSGEAADWLAENRKIHALGSDVPSPEVGQTTAYPVHVSLLCKHGVIILENVGNIDALPVTGSHVYIGALKLEHGTGTPVRLFATVGSGCSRCIGLRMVVISLATVVFKLLRSYVL